MYGYGIIKFRNLKYQVLLHLKDSIVQYDVWNFFINMSSISIFPMLIMLIMSCLISTFQIKLVPVFMC